MTDTHDADRQQLASVSPETFQQALDRSLDAVTILRSVRDTAGTIVDFTWVYVNAQAAATLRRPIDTLLGARLLDSLPGNRSGGLFERYRSVVESGIPQDGEIAYDADGISGWFRNMAVRLGDGVAIFFRDITSEKQTAEALRVSEERRRLAVSAAGLGDWYLNLNSRHYELSPHCKAHFGLPPDAAPTRAQLLACIHPAERAQAEAQLRATLLNGSEFTTTPRVIWPDGSLHWITIRGQALPDRSGELVGVTLDVTEQVWAEQSQRLLAEVGRALAETTDYEAVLSLVVRLALPDLADYCMLYLCAADGAVQRTVTAHRDPQGEALLRDLEQRYPFDPAGNAPVAQVLRNGRMLAWAELSAEQLEAMSRDAGQRALFQALDTRAFLVVPLDVAGRRIGALLFAMVGTARRYGSREQELAQVLAERVALAITNARLYGEAQANAHRAEEALARLNALLDGAPIGVAFLDHNLRFARVNDRLAAINGRSARAHLGASLHEVVPKLADRATTLLNQVFETRMPILDAELIGETPATPGEQRIWRESFYPVQTRDGRLLGVGVLIDDITEERRTEAALRISRDRLRLALAGVPLTLFTQDDELRYTWIYRPALGLQEHEVIGRRDEELLDAESAAELTALKRQVLASGQPLRQEVVLGGVVYDTIIEPLHDDHGAVVGITCAAIDISERKQAELERTRLYEAERAARTEAERAARQRDELLSYVTHDMKNPLTAIFGQAQMLQHRLTNPAGIDMERLRRGMHTLQTAATNLNTLLNELQDVARLQAGHPLDLQHRRVDLLALIQQAVTLRQAATRLHDIRIESALATLPCDCDPARIERALTNILANAVKYSPKGGLISVRLAQETRESIPWVQIQVQDSGVGILPEDQPHIFDHFYRGGNVAGVHGTGLGLASAAAIIAQHGGQIGVASVLDQGTIITMEMPQFYRANDSSDQ